MDRRPNVNQNTLCSSKAESPFAAAWTGPLSCEAGCRKQEGSPKVESHANSQGKAVLQPHIFTNSVLMIISGVLLGDPRLFPSVLHSPIECGCLS